MHDFTFGDILFIILTFGVIHGIMAWVHSMRRRKSQAADTPDTDK